ncbi:hypothetical protein [Sphingosinicella sp. CPCC 101087]|uniref:hypothetical protein n=1 Tax=Sphingosinicella sp. CPCC 101087 TaxID=2497754 RepID=UPI00101DDC09|nr:hypothetical protein [Sphingosinicella sp. CPCC 101087]
MPTFAKILIGAAAALLAGWIAHGPLGQGKAFADRLQARAEAVVVESELPGVSVRIARDPLARQAILSGSANQFQREGQGTFPGLNDRIGGLAGIAGVRWDDEGRQGGGIPLLLETWLIVLIAFLVGLGIGWRWFRPRPEGYL